MSLYLTISNGLRGCYLPDNVYVARFATRKELRQFLTSECSDMREAYGFGGSKKEIAATAAWCWKHRKAGWGSDMVIGFGCTRSISDRPFGLMLGHATRREYSEYQKENN